MFVTTASTAEWNRIAATDSQSTFFQTPAWGELVESMDRGLHSDSLVITFNEGLEAVVPRMRTETGRALFRSFESMPPGVYGAPLSPTPLTRSETVQIGRLYRGSRVASGVVVEVPGRPLDLGLPRETMFTHGVELLDSDGEFERYRKGHRAAIRQSRREGVEVVLASDESQFNEYWEVYRQTVARWRQPPSAPYAKRFFLELWKKSRTDDRIRLWLARRKGRVLAGALALHQGAHAAYWHGASTDEGRELKAGHLAVHTAIADARVSRRRLFDLMPSGGHDSVAHFKNGFGATMIELGVHRAGGSWMYHAARRVAASLPRRQRA